MSDDRNESVHESREPDDEQREAGSEAGHPAESVSDKVKSLLPDGWLDR
ncbi:hypothetical protein KNO15_09205 [Leifsonia shinshuensis]|nr:hypothetical protein [Leifsonia shinshuensis]MCI0156871.1 hypothetical protein [Leifsonia shinshuensis]